MVKQGIVYIILNVADWVWVCLTFGLSILELHRGLRVRDKKNGGLHGPDLGLGLIFGSDLLREIGPFGYWFKGPILNKLKSQGPFLPCSQTLSKGCL